jgi:hypothetical protein
MENSTVGPILGSAGRTAQRSRSRSELEKTSAARTDANDRNDSRFDDGEIPHHFGGRETNRLAGGSRVAPDNGVPLGALGSKAELAAVDLDHLVNRVEPGRHHGERSAGDCCFAGECRANPSTAWMTDPATISPIERTTRSGLVSDSESGCITTVSSVQWMEVYSMRTRLVLDK